MALDLNEDKDLNEKVADFFSKNKKNILIPLMPQELVFI